MVSAAVNTKPAAKHWLQPTGLMSGRWIAWLIVALVAGTAAIAFAGFLFTSNDAADLNAARLANREMRIIQIGLIDAETGVRGYVMTGSIDYLEPYSSGIAALKAAPPELIAELDRSATTQQGAGSAQAPFTSTLAALRGVWSAAISKVATNGLTAAQATLVEQGAKKLMDTGRAQIGRYIDLRYAAAERTQHRIYAEQDWLVVLNLLGAATAVAALIYAFGRAMRDGARRDSAVRENAGARRQIEQLFSMAEMLQSATDRDDANEVLRATATQLMPQVGGALYVFNNSRDRLDLSTAWLPGGGLAARDSLADHITPSSCWALKRGKPHRNLASGSALRCSHRSLGDFSLEIPMAARGELYGLLELTASDTEGEASLIESTPIASALADAMSLALSNISLREKLRNQALRDPLTGLYNRRFLEEMLERLRHDAERKRTPLSAIMLDLDHFKKLNDQFGHAAGDEALRRVASTILGRLRATDVACRYGGEEIAILLPDCKAEMALTMAEQLRESIAAISGDGQIPPVTCSAGVSSIPESCDRGADLLATADKALYAAKQGGRNRVIAAPIRVVAKLAVAE